MFSTPRPNSEKEDQLQSDILKIAHYILEKTLTYAPFSSNKNVLENISEEHSIHRLLWINAMRARNDSKGIRQIVRSWNLDVSSAQVDEKYEKGTVQIKGKSLSLVKLNNYIYDKLEPIERKTVRKDGTPFSSKERIESVAKRVIEWGIGNCNDLSQTAFAMLLHYPEEGFPESGLPSLKKPVRIEIMTIEDDDHEFIVINRQADSDPCDPHTWGNDTVILDPWFKECYLLKNALSGTIQCDSAEDIFGIENDQASDDDESKSEEASCHLAFLIIEDSGHISEGPSDHWNKKHEKFAIFQFEARPIHPKENIPWNDRTFPEADKSEQDPISRARRLTG